MTNKKMYGLQTIGRVRVFRKDKVITGKNKKTYDITDVWFNVSEKEEDGTYFNRSMNLLFKRGIDLPENNTTIELRCLSGYHWERRLQKNCIDGYGMGIVGGQKGGLKCVY